MSQTTIEWTKRPGTIGETWNPTTGCDKVSQGCRSCYAETMHRRLQRMMPDKYNHEFLGGAHVHPETLLIPFGWRRPRTVFCNSMSDLFHPDVPFEFIDRVLAVIAMTPQHTYQVLTKRPERMREYLNGSGRPNHILRAIDAVSVDVAMDGVAEEWRDVADFPGYRVSNYGSVTSVNKTLKLRQSGRYLTVSLCRDGEVHDHLVHRLVLTTFTGAQPTAEARHLNGTPHDNRLANLAWGTKADNMQDAARHGTAGVWMKGRAMLEPFEVEAVRLMRAKGEKLAEIAKTFGLDKRQVSAICLNKTYKPPALAWPIPNLWIGTSTEDQRTAAQRIPELLNCPAAVRFISAEPLLGAIDLSPSWQGGLHWVITGGESGARARPAHPDWFRHLRDRCAELGIAYFFKQWGQWEPTTYYREHEPVIDFNVGPGQYLFGPPHRPQNMVRVRKKSGNLLDGRTHLEFPNLQNVQA